MTHETPKKAEELTTDEAIEVLFPPEMAEALREEIEANRPSEEKKEPIEEYDA